MYLQHTYPLAWHHEGPAASTPTLMPLALHTHGTKTTLLAAGASAAMVVSEHGRVLSTLWLPHAPSTPLVSVQFVSRLFVSSKQCSNKPLLLPLSFTCSPLPLRTHTACPCVSFKLCLCHPRPHRSRLTLMGMAWWTSWRSRQRDCLAGHRCVVVV